MPEPASNHTFLASYTDWALTGDGKLMKVLETIPIKIVKIEGEDYVEAGDHVYTKEQALELADKIRQVALMEVPLDLNSLADELQNLYPELIVSIGKNKQSIAIHPPKSGHPQVNIRLYEDRVEWQGYWSETRWSFPFGARLGMPGFDYVIPSKWGRACDRIKLKFNEKDRVLELTKNWFEQHPPGEVIGPPQIPEGYRLATEEEMRAANRACFSNQNRRR